MSDATVNIVKGYFVSGESAFNTQLTVEVPLSEFGNALHVLREFDRYVREGGANGTQGETGNEG